MDASDQVGGGDACDESDETVEMAADPAEWNAVHKDPRQG